jgi:hypothetical protein
MNEPIKLTMGGKSTIVTREDAVKHVLVNLALSGDKQAAKFLLQQLEKNRPFGEEAMGYIQTNATVHVNLIESPHKLEKEIAKPEVSEEGENNRKK